ncbi:hypothetical protein LUZ60_001610 [Juncus effusus]|nr:hypothetical protein LUZ60_001610 [Juncus effusus]
MEKRHLPQLPWLVLADDETSGKQRFFNMSENKHYQFDIPELHGAYIVGSSFGWLFAVGPKLDAYLVNPFSGAKFTLPALPFYGEDLGPETLTDVVERDEYGRPRNLCFERIQHTLVRKAVLSADPSKCTNFTVSIMLNGDYRLAFFKFGDTTWTVLDHEGGVSDIIFFKGQFYAIIGCHNLATVDVGPLPKLSGHKWLGCRKYSTWDNRYLVSFGMHLLFVLREHVLDKNDNYHCITTDFRVFKVDLGVDNTSSVKDIGCTSEMKDIEGHALFLGKNCSIVVRASDFNGCMANSLYFSSDSYFCNAKKYGYDDMGVYKLEDGSIEPFYPPEIYMLENQVRG